MVLTRLRISTDNLREIKYVPPPLDPDEMVMDGQTYADLEIFEAQAGETTLFDLCNATRTDGGAKALRIRMKKPWCRPEKIRAVQSSLTFILGHRAPFDRVPSGVTMRAVEKYLNGSLPLPPATNVFEFWTGALEIRFGDVRPYGRIMRGVHATSAMIRSLRRLTSSPDLRGPSGELASLLAEVRSLVSNPAFHVIGEQSRWDLPWWTLLRIDRLFRRAERASVERLVQVVFELDALVAMADVVDRNRFVMPEIAEGSLGVSAEGVFHPFIAEAVPNPIRLDQGRRMLFLTGPNMAGKTTYLRACGIALYLAHLGMGVPSLFFRFSPCQRLFGSIMVHDNVRAGVSFFRAEALRVKAIAKAVTDGYRVVALMDEPFKGTNVKDALDASRAVLERFAVREGSLFLVSSHLIELGEQMSSTGQVDCQHFEAGEQDGRLTFEYRLRPGVSTQRLGMRVLREEGIFALLDGAVGAASAESPLTA